MVEQWLGASWLQLALVALSAAVIFAAVITYTRIAGLRSFSKMSSFDFAATVAIGSVMATTAVTDASLLNGLVALGVLYLVQTAIAAARRVPAFHRLVDNTPVLLMAGTTVLEENLRGTRMTEDDLRAKLREANVTDREQILAVVLETTGDVTVLHGEGPLDRTLLDGVHGAERLG